MVTRLATLRVKIPEELLDCVDLLVKAGIYANKNEAIRDAIRQNMEEK